MERIIKQKVLIEFGNRLYTLICPQCGGDHMNENTAMSGMECASCGSRTQMTIRDSHSEKIATSEGMTEQ